MCLKTAGWVANSVDSAASDLGLNCLLKRDHPNIWVKYVYIHIFQNNEDIYALIHTFCRTSSLMPASSIGSSAASGPASAA